MKYWGICPNNHWGPAPAEYDQRHHFLFCPECKLLMYLNVNHPKGAGYRDENFVAVQTVPQGAFGE